MPTDLFTFITHVISIVASIAYLMEIANHACFVDTRFLFGDIECPEKFQCLANAITRMMQRHGHCVVSYLDDFLIIALDEQQCQAGYDDLLHLLQSSGFTVNSTISAQPSQKLTFLGIHSDSIK